MFKKGFTGPSNPVYPQTQADLNQGKPQGWYKGRVNPMVGNSHGMKIPSNFSLQESTEEIAMVRFHVEGDEMPTEFLEKYNPFSWELPTLIPEPLALKGLKYKYPQGLANVVHMDNPMDAPMACLKWLLESERANVNGHTGDYKHFIESVPHINLKIASAQYSAIIKGFEVKDYFGIDRPEEVMFDACMTAYQEGCPAHASFPAGHAVFVAAGVKVLIDNFQLTEEQKRKLLNTAYLWAMFRSFAGVHHAVDNVAGLIVGGLGEYFKPEILASYTE